MDEKEIRAIELVRSIRDQLYEETKQLSPEEFVAFIAREAAAAAQHSESKAPAPRRSVA